MSRCIKCGEKGHLLLACPEFYEDLMKPQPGTCARCKGPGTFTPYVAEPVQGRRPARIEALLVCPCCSYPECRHRCPFVDSDGIQCRGPYGHGRLTHGWSEGFPHDCPPGKDNVRVGQYGGRRTPRVSSRRQRVRS